MAENFLAHPLIRTVCLKEMFITKSFHQVQKSLCDSNLV